MIGFNEQEIINAYNDLKKTNPMNDDLWHGLGLEMRCIVARGFEDKRYLADHYESDGFKGVEPGHTKVQKQRYPVFVFRKNGTNIEPTPNPNSAPPTPTPAPTHTPAPTPTSTPTP